MSSEFAYIAMNRFSYGADNRSVKTLAESKSIKRRAKLVNSATNFLHNAARFLNFNFLLKIE